ncbi:MAG: hypothetical protein MZV70_73030 [Desulfobacterales bacterium]|nr:hypothetical protein [Desulfobacterales bacterium]
MRLASPCLSGSSSHHTRRRWTPSLGRVLAEDIAGALTARLRRGGRRHQGSSRPWNHGSSPA